MLCIICLFVARFRDLDSVLELSRDRSCHCCTKLGMR